MRCRELLWFMVPYGIACYLIGLAMGLGLW